ncbi:hypothetical protein IMG5_181770 [Ichthyophthirius multifiliis]|uniref:Calmodulin n=1 Tax=Ichthyophthirius multifiliis TaxID=5932 RepID=G0R2Y8_ICHMU|nr:hypothetical protein IMG5_181770 [Ichthyophthirius multifiliis]EGR28172.1 hypothetical protein IMG5_181770 [Ichthyophthirius multifiliis]|eukprot:XP_004027517.1 hypothetical protein IMG5_181770 [Ichthyophthirius multifiliis]
MEQKIDIQLTQEQIADYREKFTLFDKDGDGYIKISELGLLIRGSNQNPTDAEIQEYQQEIDQEGTGKLDFPEFLALMARKIKETDPEEELMEAFRIFDKNNSGIIESQHLRHLVRQLGEQLSEEETDQMIKEADPKNTGYIRYAEFVRFITTQYLD